jgi:hypothetical protein
MNLRLRGVSIGLKQSSIVFVLAASFASSIARADTYRLVVLDVPGGANTAARGINSAGGVVGTFTRAGRTLGFLCRGGTFSQIEVPGAAVTVPSAIDNAGRIVGYFNRGDGLGNHGFLFASGNFTTLDVPGAVATEALGIDNAGQIVGSFTDSRGNHGFTNLGSSFTPIDVRGAVSTTATGINDAHEIVGTYVDTNSRVRGFLYAGGLFSTLDSPGGEQPVTLGINNARQIVGLPGFLYRSGIFAAIELTGAAGGINNAGRIVGSYLDASGQSHGFLATPSTGPALTSAVPTPTLSANAAKPIAKVSSGAGPCDIDGDGSLTAADVQSIINEALGKASPVNDLNSDHVVNVLDIQVVVNAVLSLGCSATGGGTVAHLTVQSGNGQVLCILPSCTLQHWQPISIKATNASGNPVAGATVAWTVTSGQITLGGPTSTTSVTDSNGIATQALSETIFVWTANPFYSYEVNNIQATSNNISVTFTETRTLENPSSGSSEIAAEPPMFNGDGLGGAPLSAPSGTTLSTPILEWVAGLDQASNGVPNIAVRLINQQTSPTLTCVTGTNADPGSVLTDAHGNALCYPIFSGSGTGTYYVSIGGVAGGSVGNGAMYFAALGPLTFTSIAGEAAAVPIGQRE